MEAPFYGLWYTKLEKVQGVAGRKGCSRDLLWRGSTSELSFIKMVSFLSEISMRNALMSKSEESIWQSKPIGIPWGKPKLQALWRQYYQAQRMCSIPTGGICTVHDMHVWEFSILLSWGQAAKSLIAGDEHSSMCKTFQTAQFLMSFHISLPLRNRDLKTISLILAIQKLGLLGKKELSSESALFPVIIDRALMSILQLGKRKRTEYHTKYLPVMVQKYCGKPGKLV